MSDIASFINYWNAVDRAMLKFFGIDTSDAGIEPDLIASAQEECQTPEDFAKWFGDKHGLDYLDDLKVMCGDSAFRTRKIATTDTEEPTPKAPSENGQVFRVPVRLFDLGQIVSTPGALETCSSERLHKCLSLHIRGDWGVVSAEDRKRNFEALFDGSRLLSAYPIDPAKPCKGYGENTLWIITEADRSVTTFLLPSEY